MTVSERQRASGITASERRVAILQEITTAVVESADVTELLERVLDALLELTGATVGVVFLLLETEQELKLAVQRGGSEQALASLEAELGSATRRLAQDPDATVVLGQGAWVARQGACDDLRRLRAYAAIPLHARGQALGALVVLSESLAQLEEADRALMLTIGRQTGSAVERARLFARERRRAQVMATITEVGRRLGAIRTERELLPRTVRYVREQLGYDAATLFLFDEARAELVMEAASGLNNEGYAGMRMPLEPERSIVGWVSVHNEPLLAVDVRREPRYRQGGGQPAQGAELAVPIRASGRTIGVLDVQSPREHAFDAIDASALQTLAAQIAVAIENARLNEDLEYALRRRRGFQNILSAMTSSLDLHTILEYALDAAMDVFGADRAGIYLIDPASRRARCSAARNLSADFIGALHAACDRAGYGVGPSSGQSIYLEDAQERTIIPGMLDANRREGFRSTLILPLLSGTTRLGAFVLYHNGIRHYSDDDRATAQNFANQAAVAIQHARVFEAERRARQRAATILEATRSVTSSLQVDDVLRNAVSCIVGALRQRCGAVLLLSEDGERLQHAASVAEPPAADLLASLQQLGPIVIADASRYHTVLRQRQHGAPAETDAVEQQLRRLIPFSSLVTAPLVTHDQTLGIVVVPILEDGSEPDPGSLQVAYAIARSAALALENARLYAHSQRLAVSEERNRLARELHDSVTQSLFSISLMTQALPRILERDPERARERIERLTELARGALAEMRALIFELRPAALQEEGLAAALRKHTAAFSGREGITVSLEIQGERRLAAAVEEGIFRVTQEALNNVAKHARASRVTIELRMDANEARLLIEDDGVGLQTARTAGDRTTLGLTSMRERASLLGGRLDVQSGPEGGVRICLSLPLDLANEGSRTS